MAGKGNPKTGGRKTGTPNKVSGQVKEAVLLAAERAHKGGMVGYLVGQAKTNPTAFLSLLGKAMPLQVNGAGVDGEHLIARVERVIVHANASD